LTSDIRHRVLVHTGFIVVLILAGTIGYVLLEGWSIIDALWMTITTLATVGYGEVHPLDNRGRIYTMILILFGVGTLLYILADLAEIVIHTDPMQYFGKRKMRERIEKLAGHQVVCGFGRTGQEVARALHLNGTPFVIVEQDVTRVRSAESLGYLVLQGDALLDDTLDLAQVRRATGIVCALADDASNTFITLAAKGMNENITVVCRAANPGSESRMVRAGASSVISPYVICGRRMATAVTHPLVLEFLDVAMHSPTYDLRLEQVVLERGSAFVGKTLKESNIKQTAGAMVLAVNQGGKLITNPPPELVFQSGDDLIVLGADEELKKVRQLAEGHADKKD
jgi:voltage-gated potassium channel